MLLTTEERKTTVGEASIEVLLTALRSRGIELAAMGIEIVDLNDYAVVPKRVPNPKLKK